MHDNLHYIHTHANTCMTTSTIYTRTQTHTETRGYRALQHPPRRQTTQQRRAVCPIPRRAGPRGNDACQKQPATCHVSCDSLKSGTCDFFYSFRYSFARGWFTLYNSSWTCRVKNQSTCLKNFFKPTFWRIFIDLAVKQTQ